MKKIVTQILIAAFTLGCLPAYADDDSSSSSSGGGGGGGAGVGIAIGAAAIIGLLVWALSDKKEPETPALEERPRLTAPASGGVGNVKGMEY